MADLTELTEALNPHYWNCVCDNPEEHIGKVAEALAPLIAEARREGAAEAWDEGYAAERVWASTDNPYRASAVSGEPKLSRNPFGPKDPA